MTANTPAATHIPVPGSLSRRQFLYLMPATLMTPAVLTSSCTEAQPADSLAVRKLHGFGLRVNDIGRSLAFYQDFLGAAVQEWTGHIVYLQIGSGPQHFSLSSVREGEVPGYTNIIRLTVADFDLARVRERLRDFGIVDAPGNSSGLYFTDADGLSYELRSLTDCGGDVDGDCETVEATPGLFRPVDINHFTNFVADANRANEFYTRLFGLRYQAYQGPNAPIIGVGDGLQFLMYITRPEGNSPAASPANSGFVHHACLSIENFDVAANRQAMTDYGLTALDSGGANPPPLSHWVSMRMPNRGGAEGGTPELYFTDPDGIRMQLQALNYCGGGGYLGDSCPPL